MIPVIGIVGRIEKEDLFDTLNLNQDYIDAVIKFGGNPLILCQGSTWNQTEEQRLLHWLEQCDGVVLSGGTGDPSAYDFYILDYAVQHELPILGICFGMQTMAMYQSQEKTYMIGHEDHKKPGVKYVHSVNLDSNSRIYQILQKSTIEVNSRHVEHVKSGGIFQVVGTSDDGLIEVLENPHHPFQIGVQWHPESMVSYDESARKIWEALINTCKKNKD